MGDAPVISREEFDEQAYLDNYDDVRAALQDGSIESAWWHYANHGLQEGRRAFTREQDVDQRFYLKAYPLAKQEIDSGLATDAGDHYRRYGRARGYLPAYTAQRLRDPTALPSPFGGLWPDAANALDRIAGRLELGWIDTAQAARLQNWVQHGYATIEGAIPEALLDAAEADLDRAYAGGFDRALFECKALQMGNIHWREGVASHPAKVLDLHHFSPALRNLMFAPAITAFLGLLFESKAFATQSLGFLLGSGQEGHQDSAYVPFTLARSFAATWIALEDVTIGAGELFYYPGSHRFPEFFYGGRYKSVAEAERNGCAVEEEETTRFVRRLRRLAKARNIDKSVFCAKRGDVLVWHADLVHGGNPVTAGLTRKSFVTHYCPKRFAPLFSEEVRTDLFEHDGHLLTSHVYKKADYVAG